VYSFANYQTWPPDNKLAFLHAAQDSFRRRLSITILLFCI
jgi:hypothetical protein